ncbi:hypothetical protein F4805DRAFT_275957 [Annulohypoxylon moriforme]|nr:hypothetical protein F4805DRAFT_275957 [Annulohypoxylon moriforme]
MDRVVFRLRQLPPDIDRLDTARLLGKALGVEVSTIRIFSLASSVYQWTPSKVATLMFEDASIIQQVLEEGGRPGITKCENEWKIEAVDLGDKWILDSHFRGLTTLYDPPSHMADCIAISGLASHPFGSWQPKGQSRSFMWIRDALPKSLPNVRPILYGYDSTLTKSHSFQSALDIARALIGQLKANVWASPHCKPLAFLAHSLGGIILKQAIVSLASMNDHTHPILQAMKGAVFFGVPNLGMEQSHLEAIVEGQANSELIKDLSTKSTYLHQLDEQFSGISVLQESLLYWWYETMESPTVTLGSDEKWLRTGPKEILVTRESATRGLDKRHMQDLTYSIDKDHSSMVKFSEGDPDYLVLVQHLKQIFSSRDSMGKTEGLESTNLATYITQSLPDLVAHSPDTLSKADHDILTTLYAPETHRRLQQIENQFGDTFKWVFDLPEPGFRSWLQKDTGLFWIRGKPGSGKSTLMKFIREHPDTSRLLSNWKGENYIQAAFFFHHRGTSLERSFEGLLRSIIPQIISKQPSLCKFIRPTCPKNDITSDYWTFERLQKCFNEILGQKEIPLHLCLFFDALDECDGPLEFLCDFLKDLSAMSEGPNKIKVCFSSRPWDIFTSSFQDCAGFHIHDFTKDDITDYCLGSIRKEEFPSAPVLEKFIPDIVTRSRGVFLWVKLLIKDLAHVKLDDLNDIQIKELLESYPIELHLFYTAIIKRIPHSHRWKTYAMLETIVRSMESLTLLRLVGIIDCSDQKAYQDAEETLWKSYGRNRQQLICDVERASKDFCGGLVEVYENNTGAYAQVLHQTVEDFVKDPRFKELILEEKARITVENGYTFLAKYWLLRASTFNFGDELHGAQPSPYAYACHSERTTGRSLKEFINSIPSERIILITGNPRKYTPIALAAYFHSRLYITESLEDSPTLLQESTEPLLSSAIPEFKLDTKLLEASMSMVKLLLEGGFRPDIDPEAFKSLIDRKPIKYGLLAESESEEDYRINMVETLLQYGQNPNVRFNDASKSTALHFGNLPPKLFEILLDNGGMVNIENIRGRTPLDNLCMSACREYTPSKSHLGSLQLEPYYQKARLLILRGGTITNNGIRIFTWFLGKLQDEGFPIDDLETCLSIREEIEEVLIKSKPMKPQSRGCLTLLKPLMERIRR